MQKRHKDRDLYFRDLEVTSREYYIDYLSDYITLGPGSRVLEVGCGEGGNLSPFADLACYVAGVDLSADKIKYAAARFGERGDFTCCDFMKCEAPSSDAERYDVILLHDVIEHIPFKKEFLLHLKLFLKDNGLLFVGFPAWQMPFGGHQQICKSAFCSHFLFMHLLPSTLYKALLKCCGEDKETIDELMSIKECRTSIELFDRLIRDCELSVIDRRLWFINPHYKQKFNMRPRLLPRWMWGVKYLRNFVCSSCWCLLR